MEIKSPHQDIGKVIGTQDTKKGNITMFMIRREEFTTLITSGIRTSDGALKNQVAKLLLHLILILTFKVHIMTMMILEHRKITGRE